MVYFVGAGTGAADLITVRGKDLIAQADVVIYAGSLVNPELLSYAKKGCEVHNSARLTLSEVIGIIKEAEAQGKMTVRLHTGDPSVYGAVREQMDELDSLGISYESCPGVSACFGAAASLNLEYTLPGVSQSLIITRMAGKTDVPEKESIESLAAHQASMAVYLSAGMLEELCRRLIAGGYDKTTPAALVYRATWAEEETYVCTVETLAAVAGEHGITRTALVIVGDVVAHHHYRRSRLYADDFSTLYRTSRNAPGMPPPTYQDMRCTFRLPGAGIAEDTDGETSRSDSACTVPDDCRQTPGGGCESQVPGCLQIISFTAAGMRLSCRVKEALGGSMEVGLYTKCKACENSGVNLAVLEKETSTGTRDKSLPVRFVETSVEEWAGRQMREKSAILFIGACGIAVRAVAPFLTDKLQDPPVLVMDEKGNYVVPILSGHVGGANALAGMLAQAVGAQPVITTATDLNQAFAVDVFAAEHGFAIENREGIAKVSAKILAGEKVTASAETRHGKMLLERNGLCVVPYPPEESVDLVITSGKNTYGAALVLRPREYSIGFGCKKGKNAGEIAQFVEKVIQENGILKTQILALASISQKREEAGIKEWCRRERIPFLTYSAEELRQMEGEFTASAFVEKQMGVDNVCERAALKACGAGGELVVHKCAENGMTIAVAKSEKYF